MGGEIAHVGSFQRANRLYGLRPQLFTSGSGPTNEVPVYFEYLFLLLVFEILWVFMCLFTDIDVKRGCQRNDPCTVFMD